MTAVLDPAPIPPAPPVCCATWLRTPNHEAGSCTCPAEHVITGLAADESVVCTFLACRLGDHQAICRWEAWRQYNVHHVSQRQCPPPPKGETP